MNKNYQKKTSLEDAIVFRRIEEKFKQYWIFLAKVIGLYIAFYLSWNVISNFIPNGNGFFHYFSLTIIQGVLFSLDGFITSLLKTPFGQMCYAINKCSMIPNEQKDYLITKATESNEHCKETLKKFGIMSVVNELFLTFIKSNKQQRNDDYWSFLLYFSYLIPLFFTFSSILVIRKELIRIKLNDFLTLANETKKTNLIDNQKNNKLIPTKKNIYAKKPHWPISNLSSLSFPNQNRKLNKKLKRKISKKRFATAHLSSIEK